MTRLLIASISLFCIIAQIPLLSTLAGIMLILVCTYQVTIMIMTGLNKALGLSSVSHHDYALETSQNVKPTPPPQHSAIKTPVDLQNMTLTHIKTELNYNPYGLNEQHIQQLTDIQQIFIQLQQQKNRMNAQTKMRLENLQQQTWQDIQSLLHQHHQQIDKHTTASSLQSSLELEQKLQQHTEQLFNHVEQIYAHDVQLLKEHHLFMTQYLQQEYEFQVGKNLRNE